MAIYVLFLTFSKWLTLVGVQRNMTLNVSERLSLRVFGLILRDGMSCDIQKGLQVELLLLCIKKKPNEVVQASDQRVLPRFLPMEVFWACSMRRKPWGRTRKRQRDYISNWPGNASGSSPGSTSSKVKKCGLLLTPSPVIPAASLTYNLQNVI